VRCREGWTWQEGEENRIKKDKTAQVIRERYKRFMVLDIDSKGARQRKQCGERYYGR